MNPLSIITNNKTLQGALLLGIVGVVLFRKELGRALGEGTFAFARDVAGGVAEGVTSPVKRGLEDSTAANVSIQAALNRPSFDPSGVFVGDANTLSDSQVITLKQQGKFSPAFSKGDPDSPLVQAGFDRETGTASASVFDRFINFIR